MRQVPDLHPTIILAFVDGEEARQSYSSIDGLHGSRRLAKQLKASGKYADIYAAIVLDMIGDRDLTITVPRNCSPGLIAMLFEAARAEGIRNRTELMQGIVYDDHVPFMAEGIKALNIMDFKYTAGTTNNFWHTPHDTIDKISAESMAVSGRLAIRVINSIVKAQ
jgi:glutaminyl-peptide cyclotransferase